MTWQEYEYKALTMLPDFLAEKDGSCIELPKVLHFDDKSHVLVLEDVGDVPSLKSWLSDTVPVDLCRSIGTSLGQFLAEVQDIAIQKPALRGLFKDNKMAKQLSAMVYFGNLPAAAARFGFHDSFITDAAAEGQREILEADEVLSLGDFWPGNILVSTDSRPGGKDMTKIYVVNLEFCQAGTKWFDIGQMAAELYCLARFRDEERGKEMLEGFLRGYKSGAGQVEGCKVAIRIGAHLVVMGPVGRERQVEQAALRKVVEEGIEMIRAGHEQDIDALRKTIVAMFLKEEGKG